MKRNQQLINALAMVLMSCPSWAVDSLANAFSAGEADLSFRYRFEHVDQNDFSRDANASTLRTRLNFKSANYLGLTFFIEADNVIEVFGDNYNVGAGSTPNNGQYPVVTDPTGTEINQAWINYTFNDSSGLKIGRQRIVLDNQRFIGGVGWRQNEQTYDAVSFKSQTADSHLFVAYIANVNRIFGGGVVAGDHHNQTWLTNWSHRWQDKHQLTVYFYDINNQDAAAFSTSTVGTSFKTHWLVGANKINLTAEFAQQTDAHNNPINYDANYMRLDLGMALQQMTFFAGYEVLEGDAKHMGASFRTPLATLHAFNGWADQFINTPDVGLKDAFVGAKGEIGAYNWQVIYHQYDAESGSNDFGDELDFSVSKKLNKSFSALLKAAQYDAEDINVSTSKYWLMLTADFL